jgi:UDP-N-acetylmuramoylalanine-D-glutamate ligase
MDLMAISKSTNFQFPEITVMAAGDLRSAIVDNRRVLVVGAGCFGLSSAYHLLQRGYVDVTVIDRSATLPAPDAASSDINKSWSSIDISSSQVDFWIRNSCSYLVC